MSHKSPSTDDNFYEPLTERELEILTLLANGLKNREIAHQLHLALRTVKWYNSQIYSKLGVNRREEAVNQAQQLGLLDHREEITTRHNLPAQITYFVGREQELRDLTNLLNNQDIRLVTIIAPGGMGKTRLALEVAHQQLKNYHDGVFFIALATLNSHTHVLMAIADALGLRFGTEDEPIEQLKDYFRDKRLLLILDNFEHLLDTTTIISEILASASELNVLVTSREKLGLSGEKIYSVGGMVLPDWESSKDALAYDAVKLFLQSAERVTTEFKLHDDELKFLARICHLTEGMPLALLLASAWVNVLSLEEIAAEIQESTDFLAVELRDIPRRQWSIRAVFDSTWKRLNQDQQDTYRKLSIFRGGFTRKAVEEVTGANIRIILSLANKSLLSLEPSGRYQTHELLRQYAESQLQIDSEAVSTIGNLHCIYFANFVQERQSQIYGGDQRRAGREIETEIENIRVMWDWAVKHTRAEEIQKSLHTLVMFYHHQSRFMEATEALEKAAHSLSIEDDFIAQYSFTFAEVLGHLGHFYLRLGFFEKSKTTLERSQEIYRAIDRSPTPGFAITPRTVLGLLTSIQGDYETAARLVEEDLERAEAADDQIAVRAGSYFLVGIYFAQGKYEAARQFGQKAYTLVQSQGDRWFSAYILNELGHVARARGDYDEAKKHFQTSFSIREEFDDPDGMAVALNHLGRILILEGNYAEAQKLYRQNIVIYRDIGDRGGLASALNGLGKTTLALGNFAEAEQHFHEALGIAGIQIIHITFSILTGIGELLLQTGRSESGIELLALALEYSIEHNEIKTRIEEILDHHQAELPQKVYLAAIERGKTLALETVVAGILAK